MGDVRFAVLRLGPSLTSGGRATTTRPGSTPTPSGPYTTGDNTLAADLIDRLEPGMLLFADRGFCGILLWSRALATGADLLWRVNSNMKPRPVRTFPDGSWLAELRPSRNAGRRAEQL